MPLVSNSLGRSKYGKVEVKISSWQGFYCMPDGLTWGLVLQNTSQHFSTCVFLGILLFRHFKIWNMAKISENSWNHIRQLIPNLIFNLILSSMNLHQLVDLLSGLSLKEFQLVDTNSCGTLSLFQHFLRRNSSFLSLQTDGKYHAVLESFCFYPLIFYILK